MRGIFGERGGCANCRQSIVISLPINSEITGREETIVIEANVLEGSSFPLIIGLPDIRHYNLTQAYLSHFKDEILLSTLLGEERVMSGFTPEHSTLVLESHDINQNFNIESRELDNEIENKTKQIETVCFANKAIRGVSPRNDLYFKNHVTPRTKFDISDED